MTVKMDKIEHMSHEELIGSLHRVGRLYWHRPDTADCLVKVFRLSGDQHDHHRHQRRPCLCSTADHADPQQDAERGQCLGHFDQSASPSPPRPTHQTHSAPNSASAATSHFSYDSLSNPASLTVKNHLTLSGQKSSSSIDTGFHRRRPELVTYSLHRLQDIGTQSAQRSRFRAQLAEDSRHRTSTSAQSTLHEACSSLNGNSNHTDVPRASPVHEWASQRDTRRESAPSNLQKAASAIAATPRCLSCRLRVREPEKPTTYRLHKDFLVTQSDAFKELLRLHSTEPSHSESSLEDVESRQSIQARAADHAEPFCSNQQTRKDEDYDAAAQTCIEIALPDPTSFGLLIEYFYMGDFGKLTAAMETGRVRWEKLMLNASHLGLSQGLKMKLGAWWRDRQERARRRLPRVESLQGVRVSSVSSGAVPVPTGVVCHHDGSTQLGGQASHVGSRPRACTTESRVRDWSEERAPMTPSRAFALSTRPSSPAEERSHNGCKRRRDTEPAIEAIGRQKRSSLKSEHIFPQPLRSTSSDHLERVRSTPVSPSSPRVGRKVQPEERWRQNGTSEGLKAASNSQIEREARGNRASAVRQLLLGGRRRRALSSLAYYCSIVPPSGMPAPIKQ